MCSGLKPTARPLTLLRWWSYGGGTTKGVPHWADPSPEMERSLNLNICGVLMQLRTTCMAHWWLVLLVYWWSRVQTILLLPGTRPIILVAPELPRGGLWLGHVLAHGWPPIQLIKNHQIEPMRMCHLAQYDSGSSLTSQPST